MSQLPTPPFKRIPLTPLFEVNEIITVLLFDFASNFSTLGESHDFWEFVYVDRGELDIHAGDTRHRLRSGDMVFHRPMEFHNIECDGVHSATVFIMTFDCKSDAMSHFTESYTNVTIEELSEHFRFGKSHLCEVFKRSQGTSILQYYLRLKLTEAKRLVHEENVTVGEISERLGFESQSYFARLFKKHVGLTPREFRAALVSDGAVHFG